MNLERLYNFMHCYYPIQDDMSIYWRLKEVCTGLRKETIEYIKYTKNVNFSAMCINHNITRDSFTSIMKMLPEETRIRVLDISNCFMLSDIDRTVFGNMNLSQVQVLRLNRCPLKHLPLTLRFMVDLRELDVSDTLIIAIPDLLCAGLQKLDTLRANNCANLVYVSSIINTLSELIHLEIANCMSLTNIVLHSGLKNLQILILGGTQMCYMGHRYVTRSLSNLRVLDYFEKYAYNNYSLQNLTNLTKLRIDNCGSNRLWDGCENLTALTELSIIFAHEQTYDIDFIGVLTNLTKLEFVSNNSLLSPPVSMTRLVNLKILVLEYIEIEYLNKYLQLSGSLTNLQTLAIETVSEDFTFPQYMNIQDLQISGYVFCSPGESEGNLVHLTSLTLHAIQNCSDIHFLFEYMTKLDTLRIYQCDSLTSVPDNIGNLTTLVHLSISANDNIHVLPETLCNLPNLRTLDLSRNLQLQCLPNSFGNLTTLRILELTQCRHMHSLSHSFEGLINMRELWLDGCNLLAHIPFEISELPLLQQVTVDRSHIGDITIHEMKENRVRIFYI